MTTYGWLLALGTAYLALLGWGLQTAMVLSHEADGNGPSHVAALWISPALAYQMTALLVYILFLRWIHSGAPAWADLAEYQEFFVVGSAAVLGRQIILEPGFPIPRAAVLPTARRVPLQLVTGTPWWVLLDPEPVTVLGLEVLPRWLGMGRPLSRVEEFLGVMALAAGLQWLAVHLQRRWRTFRTRKSLTPR